MRRNCCPYQHGPCKVTAKPTGLLSRTHLMGPPFPSFIKSMSYVKSSYTILFSMAVLVPMPQRTKFTFKSV